MELNFTKEGNKWVAEFEATNDFNLHIEREQVAYINIMQRGSSNGEYDLAKSFSADKTFDYDFGALVYPKYIKVVSGSEVVNASVNFNEGGGSGNGSGDVEVNAEYYRIDWNKLNELGYTDDNFNNNASYFTRNSFFYCSKYKMEAQGDSGMMDMRDLLITITMMSDYFKYSFITQVEFVPFTDSNGETFNSLQDAWRWSSQPFNEIFIPITKEEFYNLE